MWIIQGHLVHHIWGNWRQSQSGPILDILPVKINAAHPRLTISGCRWQRSILRLEELSRYMHYKTKPDGHGWNWNISDDGTVQNTNHHIISRPCLRWSGRTDSMLVSEDTSATCVHVHAFKCHAHVSTRSCEEKCRTLFRLTCTSNDSHNNVKWWSFGDFDGDYVRPSLVTYCITGQLHLLPHCDGKTLNFQKLWNVGVCGPKNKYCNCNFLTFAEWHNSEKSSFDTDIVWHLTMTSLDIWQWHYLTLAPCLMHHLSAHTEIETINYSTNTIIQVDASLKSNMTPANENIREVRPPIGRLLTAKRDSSIGTWNVRTMYQAGKATQVAHEMKKYTIQVLSLIKTS